MARSTPTPDPRTTSGGFTRRPWWRRWFGRESERIAAKFLRKLGWRIVAQNIDDRLGEIDLLAIEGQTIVVVEVRSSETATAQQLAATVNHDKQKRLTAATLRFLSRRRLLNASVRFDVLAICRPPGSREPSIYHYRHAFDAVGKYQFFS